MRLTLHTDYALRVMIYLSEHPKRLCSIGEISRAFQLSHNPMMKVVHELTKGGFLSSVRGRNGGVALARPACEITVGEVVRYMEGSFQMADCGACVIAASCGLRGVFGRATLAFLASLDATSLADLNHEPLPFQAHWMPGDPKDPDA